MQIENGSPAGGGSGSDLGSEAGQLTRYLGAIRRRWPILVALVVLGALVGWVTTPDPSAASNAAEDTPYYVATHTLISDTETVITGDGSNSGTTNGANLAQAAFLVTTGEVPVRTATKLGVSPDVIYTSVQATPRSDVASLEISAYAESADEAVRIADAAAAELVSYLGETNTNRYNQELADLQARLDKLKLDRTALEQQLAITPVDQRPTSTPELDSVINQYRIAYDRYSLKVAEGEPSAGLTTIQAATAAPITAAEYDAQRSRIVLGDSSKTQSATTTIAAASRGGLPSVPPSRASRAAAGGFLGLLLGIAIVLILDRFDTRLRRREEVESATNLPVLSEIPPLPRKEQHDTHIMAAAEPRSSAAEAYRVVRTAMVFALAPQTKGVAGSAVDWSGSGTAAPAPRGEVIMVTSPNPGEGKTTSCANLAAVFAEGGQSVLVIDCDFRRPRIHKYLADDLSLTTGFASGRDASNVIAANGELKAVATDLPGVRLVTGMGEAFPDASPIEIVAYQRQVIDFAREHFDIVILDTAPFLTTNDASELLSETDTVILVVRAGKTQYASAKRAAEFLQRLDAPVLGVVMTGSADATAAQYYYHYYLDQDSTKKRRNGDAKGSGSPEPARTNGNGATNGNGNGTSNGATVVDPPAAPAPPADPLLERSSVASPLPERSLDDLRRDDA